MAAQPCAKHPQQLTLVRCGRCDTPICDRCMVDSPVGKKCRECAWGRTGIMESTPRQLLIAFLAATAAAVPAGWLMQSIPLLIVLAFVYGWVVGETALRAGQRRRGPGMQAAAGVAALIGGCVGAALVIPTGIDQSAAVVFVWSRAFQPYALISTVIGVVMAVSRVRFL